MPPGKGPLFCVFFLFFFFSAFAQSDVYSPYEDSSKQRIIKALRKPQQLDTRMTRIVSAFVETASLRFKRTLHPAFANLDSLYPEPQSRRQIERNPYVLLNPALRGYNYEPVFRIENMPVPFNNTFYRNVFIVVKYDCFIRPEDPVTQMPADTLWSNKPYFFGNDDLFAVYYCPPTGDLRMLGGNAFLEQLPLDAQPIDIVHNFDEDAMIMARTRLIHHFVYQSRSFNWVYFNRDTMRQRLYEAGKYRYYNLSKSANRVFGPASCRLISVPVPRLYTVVQTSSHSNKTKVLEEPEKWDKIELVYYTNQPDRNWDYEKGFPCYEIKWVVLNEPKSYAETLPQIRGVSAEALKALQADPEWLNYIFIQ